MSIITSTKYNLIILMVYYTSLHVNLRGKTCSYRKILLDNGKNHKIITIYSLLP